MVTCYETKMIRIISDYQFLILREVFFRKQTYIWIFGKGGWVYLPEYREGGTISYLSMLGRDLSTIIKSIYFKDCFPVQSEMPTNIIFINKVVHLG